MVNELFAVLPQEIARTEYYSERDYRSKTLILKRFKQMPENYWQYVPHYWRVFYNASNQVIAETLFIRGNRVAYWSYHYQTDGRIVRKGFHWGGIRDGVYYDMNWGRYVLKRGFSYYNERFKYEVYDNRKRLIYEEFYNQGRFDHFARYYYDTFGHFLRIIRSTEYHLRGRHYDYVYSGRSVMPHSVPRTAEQGSGTPQQRD